MKILICVRVCMLSTYLTLYICLYFLVEEDITGGKIEFSMDYGRVPIFSKTLDLCAGMELLNIGLTCPISAGTYEKSARIHIPFGLPEVRVPPMT